MDIKRRAIRIGLALMALTMFIGLVTLLFYYLGIFEQVENIYDFSNSIYGYVMYYVIYMFVKFSLFIPLSVVIIPFAHASNFLTAVIIGSIAEITGGLLLYLIGLTVGKKIIVWMTDEQTLDKWETILHKGKYTIFLMLLFPFSPNQIIMVLSGSGRMKMKIYLPMICIAQPIGVVTTVLIGSTFIEHFRPLWISIPIGFVLIVSIMYASFRYQGKIDQVLYFIKRRLVGLKNLVFKKTKKDD